MHSLIAQFIIYLNFQKKIISELFEMEEKLYWYSEIAHCISIPYKKKINFDKIVTRY